MAYEQRIARLDAIIPLHEWLQVIDTEPRLRLATGDLRIHNPSTDQVISFPQSGGDCELFFPPTDTWQRVFYWSKRGYIFFATPAAPADLRNHILRMSQHIARRLGAQVMGEEGEELL